MPRRVHREQHPPHLLEPDRIEILEDDTALARREQDRMASDVVDIGVLEHRPIARFAGHVLPVDGLATAKLGEDVVRRTSDVPLRVVEVVTGYPPRHADPNL